jgi:hypothetical protein
MPITPTNPFKGRQYPGEVILLVVRWYLTAQKEVQYEAEIASGVRSTNSNCPTSTGFSQRQSA